MYPVQYLELVFTIKLLFIRNSNLNFLELQVDDYNGKNCIPFGG